MLFSIHIGWKTMFLAVRPKSRPSPSGVWKIYLLLHRRRGRGSLGGEFAASHYNQWGLCCIVVWKCVQRLSCRLVWWVGWVQAFMC